MMTFKELLEILSTDYVIDVVYSSSHIDIQDIALIDNKHIQDNDSTLYFGYDKQINSNAFIPHQCILAHTNHPTPSLKNNGNYAFVEENLLFPIFNEVKKIIQIKNSKAISLDDLPRIANETRSIDTLIDNASLRIENALLFCDMNYKIIAHSSTIPIVDPLWESNIKQGFCSYEFISEVKQMNLIRTASPTTTKAVEVTCPKSPYRKLSSKVFHNKIQIGFLLLIEGEHKIQPYHHDMLGEISDIISNAITCYIPDLIEEINLPQQLLYDLLIGAPPKDILPRLSNIVFPPQMVVLFIKPTQFLGRNHLNKYTYINLKTLIPETIATYHQNGIVAIIPYENPQEKDDYTPVNLLEFTTTEFVRIGISNPFSNIEKFVNHFNQSFSALEHGQRLNSEEAICHYSDYQIFDLFSEIKSPEILGRFCHPALETLRQYDYKNGTALYETLCMYLKNKKSIKATSSELYIHRNSLVYRLNRITEICQIDLDDLNTVFLLHLSFQIDFYNNLSTIKL